MTVRPARPRRSTRHRRWQDVELAALDFETTGLDLGRDAVISFGVVPILEGRIDLSQALYREVAPDAALSPVSIAVHHLRPVDLKGAPPFAEVADSLRRALDYRYVLAWAAQIEVAFLTRLFGGIARRWKARTIDVLRLAGVADRLDGRRQEEASYALEDVVARSGLPVEESHHALNDALMTAEMFLFLASRLGHHGYGTIGGVVKAARGRGHDAGPRRAGVRRRPV